MAFYDSVKEDVRDETGASDTGDEEDDMPFDQLKENADEEDPEESSTSSDTEIEVLGDGDTVDTGDGGSGGAGASTSQTAGQPQEEAHDTAGQAAQPEESAAAGRSTGAAASPAGQQTEQPTEESRPADGAADTAEVLRRIEEQNREMLDVLRGIKRSLE
ncbi:MAG: hypothetical protein SVU88_04845 [Candidatus Nanohaloarchaea archaeon]|nr:hypothetical protein [Candidatus Nanohaloarchaea archaeon]